ncbi:MAG: hypothetical protein ABIH56_08095 [Candidatus Margulisiibacteriota bacterium]
MKITKKLIVLLFASVLLTGMAFADDFIVNVKWGVNPVEGAKVVSMYPDAYTGSNGTVILGHTEGETTTILRALIRNMKKIAQELGGVASPVTVDIAVSKPGFLPVIKKINIGSESELPYVLNIGLKKALLKVPTVIPTR